MLSHELLLKKYTHLHKRPIIWNHQVSTTTSGSFFFNSYFDISLQFYGYLSQQQNMMQDYVRTGTYQRAILQNHTDFKDKVTSQWSSVHDGVIWCDSNADSDNQLHRDVLKCPTSKEKLKTSLDRWRRLKKKKNLSQKSSWSCCCYVCVPVHTYAGVENRSCGVWVGHFVHFIIKSLYVYCCWDMMACFLLFSL